MTGVPAVGRGLRIVALAAVCLALAAGAAAQMPDARQMSGIPMPSADVPAGTIVVRVVRGDVSNNVPNHPVELHVGGRVLTATTDADGRATFSGVPAGSDAHAYATVDGERVESSHMELSGTTGLRVMLVAGVGASTPSAAAAPSVPVAAGEVILGGDSRIQIEFDDDRIEVFYVLEVVNPSSAPVNPKQEVAFTLPEDAQSPAMLEGSSTQALLRGHAVSVAGPFAPGSTPVRVAFGLAGGRASRVLRQTFPITWAQVQVIVTQVPGLDVSSAQFASNNVVPNEGHNFHLGSGPALAGGREFQLNLNGLPTRSHAGRWLSVGLVLLILAIGGWQAFAGRRASASEARRAALESRRQHLLASLARIEAQQGKPAEAARLSARREDLMTQLERVYGELDQQAGPMAGA